VLASLAATLLLASAPGSAPDPVAIGAAPARGACAGAHERRDVARRRHAVRCLVNRARVAQGLRRLRQSGALARAAGGHARDMVRRDFFEHTTPGGLTPADRAQRAGYRGLVVGETIAFAVGDDATPAGAVRGWLDSPSHRAVLLDRGMRHAGVGVADGAPAEGAGVSGAATIVLDVGR
jgi:uncharacterized protein YkwD